MALLAVEGCTLQSNVTPFQITSTPSNGDTIDDKGIYRKELKINLLPGASHQTGGTLESPVTITISPQVIKGTKVDDELPLAVGDQNPITDTGSFRVGDSSVTKPIVILIKDAGQSAVNCT